MSNTKHHSKSVKRKVDTYHHGDLRKALIASALKLADEGKDWTFSLRKVARRAGVSHNAPYMHFAHKRDLLAAVATAGHNLLRQELVAAVAKIANPRVALLRIGSAYVKFGTTNPALYRLMFCASLSGPDWRSEEVLAAGVATRAILEDILRRGVRSGVFVPALTRKPALQTTILHAWATAHGLTMLAIDGLANVEHLPMELVAGKTVKTMFRSLVEKKRSVNGSKI